MKKLLFGLLLLCAQLGFAQCTPNLNENCTPNLNLHLPLHGAFQNDWDVPINANTTLIDQLLSGIANLSRLSFQNGTISGNIVFSGKVVFTGNLLATSGRPVFDVVGFGAVNDGVTNDAPAIQAAITAACANNGGEVSFPTALNGSGKYHLASTIAIPCDHLTFTGVSPRTVGYGGASPSPSIVAGDAVNGPVFQTTGGHRTGIAFRNLTIQGSNSLSGSIGIQFVDVGAWLLDNISIGFTGGPCFQVQAGNNGGSLLNSFFTSCIAGNSAADTGGIDINQPDIDIVNSYVDCGIVGTSLLGTGHTFGLLMRASSGTSHIYNIRADLCQHGIKLSGTSRNILVGGRAYHNQGNAMILDSLSGGNQIIGFQSLGSSQDTTATSSGFSIAGAGNIFSGNVCEAAGGDVNIQKNCFDDTNSNGGDPNGQRNTYSTNTAGAIGTDISGSLYNFTGSDKPRVSMPSFNETQTTATGTITLTPAVNGETQLFNTAITGAVTVTLSTTGAWSGARFRIIRGASATGAFNLTACGKSLGSASTWVDCEFLGGAWIEAATGSL